jgi:predicted nucleic acid-binding protein
MTVLAELRDRGLHVPLTDVEIAVAAEAANASLWTRDSDFQRIADVLPVRLYTSP